MMISLHCHHQAAGFRLHRSLVEMKGERGRLETLVGMRGVSLMWNAFRRYRYCYCSSPLLPPCLSVSVCVCMSMSVFVSQSVSCCCTEDLATGPVWAQCHLTGYSMYSLLSASWLYLFFSLLLSVSLLLFTTLFCFKFFFFFVNTSALRWVFAESKSCRRGLFRACCRVSDSACVGAVWGQRFSFTERQWFKSLSYS